MAKTKGHAVSGDPPKTRVSGKSKPVANARVSPSTASTATSWQKSFVYKTPSDKGTAALKSPPEVKKTRKGDMEKKDTKAKKDDKRKAEKKTREEKKGQARRDDDGIVDQMVKKNAESELKVESRGAKRKSEAEAKERKAKAAKTEKAEKVEKKEKRSEQKTPGGKKEHQKEKTGKKDKKEKKEKKDKQCRKESKEGQSTAAAAKERKEKKEKKEKPGAEDSEKTDKAKKDQDEKKESKETTPAITQDGEQDEDIDQLIAEVEAMTEEKTDEKEEEEEEVEDAGEEEEGEDDEDGEDQAESEAEGEEEEEEEDDSQDIEDLLGELDAKYSPTGDQSDLEGLEDSQNSHGGSEPNTSDLDSSDELSSNSSAHGDDAGAPAVPRPEDGAIVPVTPAEKGAAIAAAAEQSALVPARANSPFPLWWEPITFCWCFCEYKCSMGAKETKETGGNLSPSCFLVSFRPISSMLLGVHWGISSLLLVPSGVSQVIAQAWPTRRSGTRSAGRFCQRRSFR